MTIAKTIAFTEYAGNGATTAFSFPYRFFADADLEVSLISSAGAKTVKTLTTHYTMSNTGTESGGTVTMLTAPATGETLRIQRIVEATQSTDYTANDAFPAETHETALDRLTVIAQDAARDIDRAIKLPPGTDGELTNARYSRVLAFTAAGAVDYLPLTPIQTADGEILYASVTAMMASAEASRSEGAAWRAGPFIYTEAASAATDHHLTTAGGVKLYVVAVANWAVHFEQFGGVRDSATDQSAIIQAAVDFACKYGYTVVSSGRWRCKNIEFLEDDTSGVLRRASLVGSGTQMLIFEPPDTVAASDWILKVDYPKLGEFATDERGGGYFHGFTVSGRSRGYECHGLRIDGGGIVVGTVEASGIDGHGIYFSHTHTAREVKVDRLITRWCGRAVHLGGSSNAAAITIGAPSTGTDPATNNIYIGHVEIIYASYVGFHCWGTDALETRDIYVNSFMNHGSQGGAAGTGGCEITGGEGFVLIEGNVQNLQWRNGFNTRNSNTGQAASAFLVRARSGVTAVPADITIADVDADTATIGSLIDIEAGTGNFIIRGIKTNGSALNYPDGHFTVDAAFAGRIAMSGNAFAGSLTERPWGEYATLQSDIDESVTITLAADALAADTYAIRPIWTAGVQLYLADLIIVPSATVAADPTNYARIIFNRRRSGASTELGRWETTAALTSYTENRVTPSNFSATSFNAGDMLLLNISKAGSGVLLPTMTIQARFSPIQSA